MTRTEEKPTTETPRVLRCGDLEFNLVTGDVVYGERKVRFAPGKRDYKALAILLFNQNKIIDDTTLMYHTLEKPAGIDEVTKDWSSYRAGVRNLNYLIRDIKRKLNILGGDNPDIFVRCLNGYKVVGTVGVDSDKLLAYS